MKLDTSIDYVATNDASSGTDIGSEVFVSIKDKPEAATLNQVLCVGQSLSIGAQGRPPLSVVQPYCNLTWASGPKATKSGSIGNNPGMSSVKPLVEDSLAPDGAGNRGETICSGMANYASQLLASQTGRPPSSHPILISSAGLGGARLNQINKGSNWWQVAVDHIHQAVTLENGTQLQCVAFIQGENDSHDGVTLRETYLAQLRQYRTDLESETRLASGNSRILHMLTYQTVYNVAAHSDIAIAQLDAATIDDYIHLVTPIYHMPHAGDAVHLTNAGYLWLGHYFGRAYNYLLNGHEPPRIKAISATASGRVLIVKYHVPIAPLVLDETNLASTPDGGFSVRDSIGDVAVSSIATCSPTEVCIHIDLDLDGDAVVRYALDKLAPGLTIYSGGSGNLRDSTPTMVEVNRASRPLFNVAPHHKIAVKSR